MRTIVWFRGKDLRLADHEPLAEALASRGEVVPIFVVDPYFFAPERAKELPHRMQFLVDSLAELAENIAQRGSRLTFFAGKSVDVVPKIAHGYRADRVVGYRWSEPIGVERDRRVSDALARDGIPFDLFEGETLARPGEVLTGAGEPFAVFTPFARAFAKVAEIGKPLRTPSSLPKPPPLPTSLKSLVTKLPTVDSIGVSRNENLVAGGEKASRDRLRKFLKGPAAKYETGRNEMGIDGTSRISQDLKFGTVSARYVWSTAKEALDEHPKAWRVWSNELVWREFAYDVLRARPTVLTKPFRPAWKGFPWRRDEKGWRAWVEGTTGYPIVDASARQLLAEGFVHNRARMISASFLAKHLLIDFRKGEAHYMKFLTDGDWASNDLGWQWSAGCGVDAQPWFRVFNPVGQGKRFDVDGAYVRRWVPELAGLSNRHIHAPWEAPEAELARAGVKLGKTYPRPIVDLALGRGRFLAAAEGHLAHPSSRA